MNTGKIKHLPDVLEIAKRALEKQGNETLFDECGGLAFIQPVILAALISDNERKTRALENCHH